MTLVQILFLLAVTISCAHGRPNQQLSYQQQYQEYQQNQQGNAYNPYGVQQIRQTFENQKDKSQQIVDTMREQGEQLAQQLKPLEEDFNSLRDRFMSIIRPYLSSFAQQLQDLFTTTSGNINSISRN